ncbi:hypothetical protein QWZ16_19225 [Vibrio ostreicida]|uniref:Uncharacterized protein n=1 Tax=Vibrio ostreicida TaxID=526588 RepID=A0ABT8C0A5_9VIBR|nr:hypothetical protein [Vibrio ostreicida]MDN3611735.1 hypothetical protein [Vibrio ostreicida]
MASKFCSVPSMGPLSSSGDWHLPHFGVSEALFIGTRLTPEHDGHRVLNVVIRASHLCFINKCEGYFILEMTSQIVALYTQKAKWTLSQKKATIFPVSFGLRSVKKGN